MPHLGSRKELKRNREEFERLWGACQKPWGGAQNVMERELD
jgi:hypothetical protein